MPEEGRGELMKIFEEIMSGDFLNWIKTKQKKFMNSRSSINFRQHKHEYIFKTATKHIIIKLLRTSDKEKS